MFLVHFLRNKFLSNLSSILVLSFFIFLYNCKTTDTNNEDDQIEEAKNPDIKINNSNSGNEQPKDQENNNKNSNNEQDIHQNQKNPDNGQTINQNQENNNQNSNNGQNINIDLINELKEMFSVEITKLLPALIGLCANYNLVNMDPLAMIAGGNQGILLKNINELGISTVSLMSEGYSSISKALNIPDDKKEEFYFRVLLAMSNNKIQIIELLKDPEEYANKNSNKIKAFLTDLLNNNVLENSKAPLLKLISENKQQYLNIFSDDFIKDFFKILNKAYQGFKKSQRFEEIRTNINMCSYNKMPGEQEGIQQMSKFITKQHKNCEIISGIFKDPEMAKILPIQNFHYLDPSDESWIIKFLNSMCGFIAVLMAAQNEGMNIQKNDVCKMAYNFCKFSNKIMNLEQKLSKTFFNKNAKDLDSKEKDLLNIIVPIMHMIIKELITPQMGVLKPSKFFSKYDLNGFKLKPEITFSDRKSATNYLNNLKTGEKRIILTYLDSSMHFYMIEKLSNGNFKTSDPDFDKNSLNENFRNPDIKNINQIISEMELNIDKLKSAIEQCTKEYKNQLCASLKKVDVINLIAGLMGISKQELLNRLAINIKEIIQDNIGQDQKFLLCEYKINT